MSGAVVATIGGAALGTFAGTSLLGASIGGLAAGALGGAVGGFLGGGIGGELSGHGWNQGAVRGLELGAIGGGLYGTGIFSGAAAAGGAAGAAGTTAGVAPAGAASAGAALAAPGEAAAGTAATGGFSSEAGSLLLSGAKSLALSQTLAQMSNQANTFGPQRQQYANELSQLEANPSSIANLPGYQAGLQAVQRSLAAQGYSGSGNMMAALQGYGANIYNQQVQTLAGLAGAGINPAVPISGMATSGQAALAGLGLLGAGGQQMGY